MNEDHLVIMAARSHGFKISHPVMRRLRKLDRAIRASGLDKSKKKVKGR